RSTVLFRSYSFPTRRSSDLGVDEDFHKGDLLFGQVAGDPENTPNPNLGPISQGPFYAIAVVPTPLATAFRISINRNGQVVDEERSEEHTSELQSRFDLVCRL